MFGTYLVRELGNRRRQTLVIAIGMALAIALVIVVSAVAAGVRTAQSAVLESIYGVGTDITVTATPTAPEEGAMAGPRFEFGADDGSTSDGTTQLAQSRLTTGPGAATFDSSALETVLGVDGVSAATATLSLTNTTFSGELPDFSQLQQSAEGEPPAPPTGGADGAGGSAFDVDSFTVEGVDVAGDAVGPLTAASLTDGRAFTAEDAGTDVVVLDSVYATAAELGVGDILEIGGTEFEVIGLISSTSADAATSSNSYIPLDTAQELSGLEDQVSTIYVQASSADAIGQLQSDLEAALSETTVSTEADLASTVSGSLSTAGDLLGNLGTWLSVLVLAAAFLTAILFTITGVARRTREFGTLKAIGWTNRRIVAQVAGESLVQGALGGVLGVALGLIGVLVVNLVAPTLSAGVTASAPSAGPGGAGGFLGGPAGAAAAEQSAAATEIVLQAPITVPIILAAVGLAILGGLLAGAIGGWRAARLRPAEALRSVA